MKRQSVEPEEPHRQIVIGLHGYPGAGKDTVAAILRDHGYTRRGLADSLKEQVLLLNPVLAVGADYAPLTELLEQAPGSDVRQQAEWVKRTYPSFREFLQHYGELRRQIDGPDYWIRRLRCWSVTNGDPDLVVPDIRRYSNEAEICTHLFEIVRPGKWAVNNHVSEQRLYGVPFCGVVRNCGSLDDLRIEVENHLRAWGLFRHPAEAV